MHEVDQQVPDMPPEAAGDPNVWRAQNLHTLGPVSLPPQPAWLAAAIEAARGQGRAGRSTEARATLEQALAAHPGGEFGAYREKLAWREGQNARRVSMLVAVRNALRDADDPMRQQLAVRVEGFAYDRYGLEELSTERGWAERVTRRLDVFPPAWRNA